MGFLASDMGRFAAASVAFHAVVFVAAYVGLPNFDETVDTQNVPITVEIVRVTDETNLPTKPKEPKPEAKPQPEPEPAPAPPKPPAPPPAPQGAVDEPPAPPPVPEAAEEKVALITPEPKPKKEAKPKPEPEPKDEPKKVDTPKRQPAPLPPRKPTPPDEFQSVLKTLEELKSAPPPKDETPPEEAPERDFASMMENALESDRPRRDIGPELTISEIDLVRRQIQRCWNLPAGAKDAHEMQISIRAAMNPDGTVRTARILDRDRMGSDPFYRTMAESALRAVLNPACQPFKLPPEKFARWKDLKLNFDPKEMFGL